MAFLTALTRGHKAVSTAALIVALIVVVVAASAYMLLSAGGAVTISAATTLNITRSASVLRIGNGTYVMELASIAPGHNAANVYLDRLPAFMNPLLNITLYPGQETKVGAGTSFADIALQVTSIGVNAVTLMITPISASLEIAPDSAYISIVNTELNGQQGTNAAVGGSGNSATSTSVKSTTSTTVHGASTTVSVASTTVSATNTTRSRILAALQKSVYYPLMLNYSVIYANTLNCTSAVYNTTYHRVNGIAPSGFSTFENVSQFVPYALYSNISSAGSGVYSVIYYTRTRDPSYNKVAALTIGINASTETLLPASLSGVFQGANYSILLNGYRIAASVGGACAAYVT